MMPKHLHFNKKNPDDDDDVSSLARGINFYLSLFIFIQTLSKQAMKSRWQVCAFVQTCHLPLLPDNVINTKISSAGSYFLNTAVLYSSKKLLQHSTLHDVSS